MHAACLERSPRLQRVHALLSDGVERLTLGISRSASVCAVNSSIAQLRVNGAWIECQQIVNPADGSRIFMYRMIAPCSQAEGA